MILRTVTPCHQRPIRLSATPHVEHERYERQCSTCGFRWTVDRRLTRDRGGIRIDTLTWSKATQ